MHLPNNKDKDQQSEIHAGIKVFYINLECAKDRKLLMEAQFEELGLPFERIAATNKNCLTQAERAKYSKFQAALSSARQLGDGEIACALSHYRIWHRMLDENLDTALIFEDDVIIDERIFAFLQSIEQIQTQFECINLKTDRHPLGEVESVAELGHLTSFHKKPNRACSYLLTKQGASRLLEYAYPIRMPLDDLLGRFEMTKIKIYGLHPQIVQLETERSNSSTIWEGKSMLRKSRMLRKIRSLLRLFTQWF